jgi:PAS domain S-box-containing protein
MDVNNSASQIYQYTKEEFLELQVDNLQGNESDAQNFDNFKNAIEEDYKLIYSTIECHKKKNGDLLYVETKENNFIYKGSNAVIVSIEDLTQEIVQIRSIQQQNKQLREIAWTQSHIVRTPLVRIMGLINLLNYEPDIDIRHKEIYDMILHSSNELDTIISNIVDNTKNI